MIQNIIVYIIIALALGGAARYGWRKIKALKNKNTCNACTDCPLKKNCHKKIPGRKDCPGCCE